MLTLQGLWDYYQKGYLHLRIDVYFPRDVDIHLPEGLPDEIAEKLIKEKKAIVQGRDGIKTESFHSCGLSVYTERGPFHSKIDIRFPPDAKLIQPSGLPEDFKERLLKERKLTVQTGDETKTCTFNLDDVGLGVSVETAHAPRRIWEKIKKQMHEAGFSYRSESPWFHSFINGQWSWL